MTRWPATPLRSVVLPVEHGGWGFTLEPILLGLLVAPSPAGWLLGAFGLSAFLAHRPARLVLVDLHRRRRLPRTRIAAIAAGGYATAAAAAFAVAVAVTEHPFWGALLAALPLLLLQGWYEARSRTRELGREIAGPLAAAVLAPAVALAHGWTVRAATGLWLVLALRAVASVILVRAQIARVHGRPVAGRAVLAVHAAAGTAGLAAAAADVVPWLGAAAVAGLLPWAGAALRLPPVRAVTVGVTQMAIGIGVVLATAAGHWTGW